jgi:hypothetical protein
MYAISKIVAKKVGKLFHLKILIYIQSFIFKEISGRWAHNQKVVSSISNSPYHVSLSKTPNPNCFSPHRSINGYQSGRLT